MVAYDELLAQLLPPREKNTHKGDYGHVLIAGGGPGMPGAVILAGQAALRVGAGMVSIATSPLYANQSAPGLPEAMIRGVSTAGCLVPLIARSTVCVMGPGLGEDGWAQALFNEICKTPQPLVMDASALRLLALGSADTISQNLRQDWVLTPHPGEAAALLKCEVHDVQADREAAARQIQRQYGGTVVLKGHDTLVVDRQQHLSICDAGNPGMATAGMGDVLSGVIGGLIAQGLVTADAARLGVWLHAKAGDKVAKKSGERGLLASDLMPFLHQLVNPK